MHKSHNFTSENIYNRAKNQKNELRFVHSLEFLREKLRVVITQETFEVNFEEFDEF